MMPRFFFNVHDGADLPDRGGTELEDWRAAQVEAIRLAGGIIGDSARSLALGEDWTMEVTDDTGLVLFRLDFQIASTAAIMGPDRMRKASACRAGVPEALSPSLIDR